MCDFVKTKAHWNFSMLFSKILDQKVPSGEITRISNWRRILDIYREPLLNSLMQKEGEWRDTVSLGDHTVHHST